MKLLLALVVIFLSSHQVFAQGKQRQYVTPYGMAGCDLWSMVITDKSQAAQLGVFALRSLVLNSQTSAITSGTSNCVASAPGYAQIEQEVFVEVNLASLAKEAAQGGGDHLRSLSQVFGCQSEDAFAKLSQDRYAAIFNEMSPRSVLEGYSNEIKNHSSLNCTRII